VAGDPAAAEPLLSRALSLLHRWRDRAWPRTEEAPTVAALAEALTLTGRHTEGDSLLAAALAEQPGCVPLHVQRAGLALWHWEREHDPEDLRTALGSWRLAAQLATGDPVVLALGKRLAASLPETPPDGSAAPSGGGR